MNVRAPLRKTVITLLLQYKALEKMAETLHFLNNIKDYLFSKQKAMHYTHLPTSTFIKQHLNTLYSKCPKNIMKAIFNKAVFEIYITPCQSQNLPFAQRACKFVMDCNPKQ